MCFGGWEERGWGPLFLFLFSISLLLFPIFLSGVGVGVSVFGFGVFPSPFFLRHEEINQPAYSKNQKELQTARVRSLEGHLGGSKKD